MEEQEAMARLMFYEEEYRKKPFAFWRERIGKDAILHEIKDKKGQDCIIEVETFPEANLTMAVRVLITMYDEGWHDFLPISKNFIVRGNK